MAINQAFLQTSASQLSKKEGAHITALKLYRHMQAQVWLSKALGSLSRRPRQLLDLEDMQSSVRGSHYVGTRAVPIRQIQGSEGRNEDFDANFRPLLPANKSRWLSIATARLKGVSMPRVELIRVGDVYFVRDGHHRISVAKALGQEYIDADVTVWEVASQLPRERSSQAGRLVPQPA
jgi:hypothetical protein